MKAEDEPAEAARQQEPEREIRVPFCRDDDEVCHEVSGERGVEQADIHKRRKGKRAISLNYTCQYKCPIDFFGLRWLR